MTEIQIEVLLSHVYVEDTHKGNFGTFAMVQEKAILLAAFCYVVQKDVHDKLKSEGKLTDCTHISIR